MGAGNAQRRAWPQRYRVVLGLRSGSPVVREVTTVFDEAKAVAIAVGALPASQAGEVFTVAVDDLGPVPRADADGSMAIPRGDLVDRWEF